VFQYKQRKKALPMLFLKYNSLAIRTALPADALQLVAWWNDGTVMAHAGFPNGLGTTVEKEALRLPGNRMMIEENGRPIGECSARAVGEGAAEIGIKICETDCQNRGLGRVILSMLISWLFEQGFKKIVLDTNLTNLRAQHVYESLGFQKLRVNIDSWTDQLGNKQSAVDYELTEENFIDFRK
jgi:RimJ/RimL family protein N-acetyltransferase